ncbi:transcriptional regulator [Aliivibrio fischeri]|uniref:WYL domain-containing protein n=1 Tax=Aliivibrio fischeri TaxID=668 RepID=UPI001F428D7A|nr:WYL domain-containing protein [Aliivibrio fischeri]MCE7565923.1 transcriptional regulator [Aliivibrio fischeri]
MNKISFLQLQNEDSSLAERMAYIDFKLRFTGFINRSDLNDMFGLAEAAASKMMKKYTEIRPNNMEYNRSLRANAITIDTFEPLITVDAETALGMLANGFNKHKLIDKPMLSYSRIGNIPNKLSVDSVSKITRSISCGYAIHTNYHSTSSNKKEQRTLFPLAIVFDGKHWIFRAYNENDGRFKNFSFTNALNVIEDSNLIRDSFKELAQDKEWNTQVPLLLIPHKNLTKQQQQDIKLDFGIKDESKIILTERAALLWILKKQWFIDDRTDSEILKDTELNKCKFYKFKLTNKDMVDVMTENLQPTIDNIK